MATSIWESLGPAASFMLTGSTSKTRKNRPDLPTKPYGGKRKTRHHHKFNRKKTRRRKLRKNKNK